MLIIHPIIQFSAITLALYVMHMGVNRAAHNHFGLENRFNWKKHVIIGRTAFSILLIGIITGLIITKLSWNSVMITGVHGYTGLLIAFLVIIGIYSGNKLNSRQYSFSKLNILHGINNTVLLLLLIFQIYSGYKVYMTYALSY